MTGQSTATDSPEHSGADTSELSSSNATIEPAGQWQFSLRSLLVLTTAAAVAAAIAAARGAGSLVLSLGVMLTAFNSAGFLRHWQTARWRPRWVGLGWLVFLTSMFLPSARGCGDSPSTGWELAWTCAVIQIEEVTSVLTEEADRQDVISAFEKRPVQTTLQHVFLLTVTLANLILLLVPAAYGLWRHDRCRWLLGVLLAGTAFSWSLTWDSDQNKMQYGYYVWCASMMLVLTSQRLPWRYAIIAYTLLAAWLACGGFQ